MWQRAQDANQKLEQNEQTQDDDGMQARSVLYMTLIEAVSQHYYALWEGGPGTSAPTLSVSAEAPALRPRDIQHIITRTV